MPCLWVVAVLHPDIHSCHSPLQMALCQQQLPEQQAAAGSAAAALQPAQEAEQQQGRLFVQRAPPVLEQAAALREHLQALMGAMGQGLPAMLALQQALQTAVNHLQARRCLHRMTALSRRRQHVQLKHAERRFGSVCVPKCLRIAYHCSNACIKTENVEMKGHSVLPPRR